MKKIIFALSALLLSITAVPAQTKPRNTPRKSVVKGAAAATAAADDTGKVAGRTYTSTKFDFEVTFPDTWLIPDSDFEAYMKKQGFDLSLKAPDSLPPSSKVAVNKAIKRVNVLLTAYRSMPGSADNAIVRISVEDLSANPQIKDAVDYFDAMRKTFATMKLPPDFKYSDTQAEKLGDMQFGYLDVDSKAGKKRMYATVRNGFAVMFTISYASNADLETLRTVLSEGRFKLGKT